MWVKEGDKTLVTGTLSAASFWVGLRQEIYSAVMTSETLHISLQNDLTNETVSETDDYTWANRAVIHCANVLNFCFGDAAVRTEARWRQLSQDGKNWEEKLPASCKPYFVGNDDTKVFPDIWYRESCAGKLDVCFVLDLACADLSRQSLECSTIFWQNYFLPATISVYRRQPKR